MAVTLRPISEQAKARRPFAREKRDPVYLAFAKVGGGWQKIGACWRARSGEDVFSLQLTAIPLNWDGRFILAMPDQSGEPNVASDDPEGGSY